MAIKIQGTDVVNDNRELKNITNADNIIEQPTNISPSDNATDIGSAQRELTLELSSYSSLFGGQGQVEFQIAAPTTITETKIVTVASGELYEGGGSTGNVFYIDGSENPPLVLKRGNTYIFDQSDASNDGHPLRFQLTDGTSYTDGITVNGTPGTTGANVTFVVPANAPNDLEYYCNVHGLGMGGPVQVEFTDGIFDEQNLILDVSEVSSTKNSYTIEDVRSIMSESTVYYWRGRYKDNNSIRSLFSDPFQFTTTATFVGVEDPSITSPSNGATSVGETPTITSSAFATFGTSDTHESSDWQIATDSNFTNIIFESLDDTSNLESITVPSGTLLTDTQHYVRVRHTGATFGDSGYSDTVSFSTSTSFVSIDTPSITSPSDGATDIGETPTITSSAFSVSGGSDTHESSDWQIATDTSFTSIAVESLNDTSNLESFTVPSDDLNTDTTYYVRVRHTGTNQGDSNYSAGVQFTTASIFQTEETYTTPGSYNFVVPSNVSSISVVAVGGGGADWGDESQWDNYDHYDFAGGGGGLAWANNIPVTPSTTYSVVVGNGGEVGNEDGGNSSFGSIVIAEGGKAGGNGQTGGSYTINGGTGGGGNGGDGGVGGGGSGSGGAGGGGGGAGGYSGNGGRGGDDLLSGQDGSGGAGGGGGGGDQGPSGYTDGRPGGGVGLFGQGASGSGGSVNQNGEAGSNGSGQSPGGGAGSGSFSASYTVNNGGAGAVRIVYNTNIN